MSTVKVGSRGLEMWPGDDVSQQPWVRGKAGFGDDTRVVPCHPDIRKAKAWKQVQYRPDLHISKKEVNISIMKHQIDSPPPHPSTPDAIPHCCSMIVFTYNRQAGHTQG